MKKIYKSPETEITVIHVENQLLNATAGGDAGIGNGGTDNGNETWGDSREYDSDWD